MPRQFACCESGSTSEGSRAFVRDRSSKKEGWSQSCFNSPLGYIYKLRFLSFFFHPRYLLSKDEIIIGIKVKAKFIYVHIYFRFQTIIKRKGDFKFFYQIYVYIYSQTGVNDHSEGCERRKIGKESRVWSGVNELMTSRLYIQMEIVERITSIPHCIIQFYRIIQWDIRYLSSRGSIWLRYGPWRHQFTDSAIFSPILLLPRKRKFSRRRRRGRDDTRDTHTHTHAKVCTAVGVLFARNTFSLGEFDFLNFRRFIVASVALLSCSSS